MRSAQKVRIDLNLTGDNDYYCAECGVEKETKEEVINHYDIAHLGEDDLIRFVKCEDCEFKAGYLIETDGMEFRNEHRSKARMSKAGHISHHPTHEVRMF